LKDSFDTIVIGKIESDVVNTPTFTGPYGQKLPVAPTVLVVGPSGAQVQQGGPSLFGTIANGIKWFFVDAVPMIAKSEPVQAAAKAVADFTSLAAKAVADFAISTSKTVAEAFNSAKKPVTEFVDSAVKAVTQAATSTWNWIKSWF
jgi:hypothetical protein